MWFLKNCFTCSAVLNRPGRPPAIKLITDYASYVKARDETEQQAFELPGPDDKREPVRDDWFLQRGVCNPHLINGRKYVLRAYYLTLGDGRVYLYNDCLGWAHAVPFDVRNTARKAHISSRTPGADDRSAFTLSDLPEYEPIFGHIAESSKKHSVIWADTVRRSLEHPDERLRMDRTRYHIWSASHIVTADLTSYLLSLKAWPMMDHHRSHRHEHEFRQKGFDRDILRILGVDDGGVPPETPLTWIDVTWGGEEDGRGEDDPADEPADGDAADPDR